MGAIPEWYDEHISMAALWGPCAIASPTYFADLYTKENWDFLIDNGIYVIAGPNWEEDLALIKESGPEYLKENIEYFGTLENNPIKSIAHYG